MNEELLNSKLSDENIDIVLDYLKENVKDYDMKNIKYKQDENGDFIIMFDGKEIKLPKDYTVGESLYTINSALEIKEPSLPYSLLSENKNNIKAIKRNQTTQDFNIAIDLEYYTELIGVLSNYQADANSMINNSFEFSSLSGELLSFYNTNFSDSYSSKYRSILEETGKLYENTQMALMYYLSIDENLTKNIDTIIDSIFSDDYELTQVMYDTTNKDKISYDEYVVLINDNQDYFNQQRLQFLSQFMFKFEIYADQFKSIEMPKMLDSIIEMAFYAKYSKGKEYDWNGSAYDDGESLSSELNDELLVFKEELAKTYFADLDIDISELDSIDHSLIPDNYWILNTDKKNDEWVKQFDPDGDIYGYDEIITKHDLYNKFLLHASYYEESFSSISILMTKNNGYLKEQLKYPYNDVSACKKLYEAFQTIDAVRNDFNSLYNAHCDKVNEFIKYSNEWDSDDINDFCKSYINLLNQGYGEDGPSDAYLTINGQSNMLKYKYDNSFYDFHQNFNFYYDVVIDDFKNDIDEDCETESFVRSLCKYRGIEDEKIINEMLQYKDDYKSSMSIPNMISIIYKESGYDGMCSFLADYYNNIRDYCDKNNNYYQPFDHEVTDSEVKVLLMQRPETLYFSSIASAGNLYDFANNIGKELKNNMLYIKNTQETAELYLTKKLNTSSVTDAMRENAKNKFNSSDLKYLEDWQIDAYALLLSKDSSNDGLAWNLFHEGSPRGAYNNIIIQGRAYDDAKLQVKLMTIGEYMLATVSGLGYGTIDGVYNFVSGLGDVFWADGEVSEAEYRQQFIKQLLTTDYSLIQKYRDKDFATLNMLSCDYDDPAYISKLNFKNLTSNEVEEMIAYAKKNNIPRFEIEYMLDLMDEAEYQKYKSLYQMKDNKDDIAYYARLADKSWLTGYTNVIYTVGQSVGNMLIPLTINLFSSYCPLLSYLSVGLTSLSSVGKQRESLMQQGVINQNVIWTSSILHGLIEGTGEAIFGGVLKTAWGKKLYKNIEKIPGIGKLLTFTDDIIGKIDNLPFGSVGFKKFLKNDLREICEELGENVWGYLVDGSLELGWPTADEMLMESWQTIWQTALTTPILNALSGNISKSLKKTIELDNGLIIRLSLDDIYKCCDDNGNIDPQALFTLLQENDSISGYLSLNSISTNMNRKFGYNVISDCVFEDGKQYIVLYNGKKVEINYNSGEDIYSKIFMEEPTLLYKVVRSDSTNLSKLNLNEFIKKLDYKTIKSIFSPFIGKDNQSLLLELCQKLDDDSLRIVFNSLYSMNINSSLIDLYKSRFYSDVDFNKEINQILDNFPLDNTSDYVRSLIHCYRNIDWNSMFLDLDSLKSQINESNDSLIGNLYQIIVNNLKFTNTNMESHNSLLDTYVDIISLMDTKDAINHLLDTFDLNGTDITSQHFIRELRMTDFLEFESTTDELIFRNKLFDIIRNSNGKLNYLELTKLICGISEESYRTFNKYYATEFLCDYLSNNNDIDDDTRDAIFNLIRKNNSFSPVEIRRFINDGKFDYVGFLEYGLINYRFTDSAYLIGDVDFIKQIKEHGDFGLNVKLTELTNTIKNRINSFSTEEEIITYLQEEGSDYKYLSLIAYYFARDVNCRKSNYYELKAAGYLLEELSYKIIKSGNHQEIDIGGMKINVYGSDEYISEVKKELEESLSSMPDVYKKALSRVSFDLYDYENPHNLVSLFSYYHTESSKTDFQSAGEYNNSSHYISMFKEFDPYTLYHELGHEIDYYLGTYIWHDTGNTSSHYIWQSIIDADDQSNGGKRINDYSKTTIKEDFAVFSEEFGIRFSRYCSEHPENSFIENLENFDGTDAWAWYSENNLSVDYPNRFQKFKELLLMYYNDSTPSSNNTTS